MGPVSSATLTLTLTPLLPPPPPLLACLLRCEPRAKALGHRGINEPRADARHREGGVLPGLDDRVGAQGRLGDAVPIANPHVAAGHARLVIVRSK